MALTKEQLAARRLGISATDMVTIAGVSPYSTTVHDVYASKVEEAPPVEEVGTEDEREEIEAGNELEPYVLRQLARKANLVLVPSTTHAHEIMPWVIATPDSDVLEKVGGQRIAVAEVKVVGAHRWHHWGDEDQGEDGIPEFVKVQATWQMIVRNVRKAHIGAFMGSTTRCYVMGYNEDLAMGLLEVGEKFLKDHVLARVPPPVDHSEGSSRMLKKLFPRNKGVMLSATPEVEAMARELFELKPQTEALEKRIEELKNQMRSAIGENDGLIGDGWQATWKNNKTGNVSYKSALEHFAPELSSTDLDQFRSDPSRVFLCKATKGGNK